MTNFYEVIIYFELLQGIFAKGIWNFNSSTFDDRWSLGYLYLIGAD